MVRPYSYSIRDKNAYFKVSQNGEVTLTKRIDYETTSREEFEVNVFNTVSSQQEYYVKVTVEVFDENESTPWFVGAPRHFYLDHVPLVGDLVATVNATDKDTGNTNTAHLF